MKYLTDPAYHSPAEKMKLPPLDDELLSAVFNDRPPPSSGPSPMGPNGPDLSIPRLAWMFHAIKEGKHMETVVADNNYDRVDPAALFGRGKFPPTYFIHGTGDTLVPHEFSKRAYDELRSRGTETIIEFVDGAGHGFDARAQPGDDAFAVMERGFAFLKAHV
jgi:acetyl esterase/lipase